MKNKLLLTVFVVFLTTVSCKKEVETSGLPDALSTALKPAAQPPASTSILKWQKTYGSSSNELGFSIAKTQDGGYVLAGSTVGSNNGDVVTLNHGLSDAWIVRINGNGNIVWQKTFGGSSTDYAYSISATTDNGFVFCGATSSNDGDIEGSHGGTDAWVVKLSSEGNIEWQKVLGSAGEERAMSIIQTTTGDYMIAASTSGTGGDVSSNHGSSDAWIIKLNSNGNTTWSKTFGGTLGDDASYIGTTTDGFMIGGATNSSDGDLAGYPNRGGSDAWLLKISANGDVLWQKTYGGSGNEGGGSVKPVDGGYVFSTSTTSNNGNVSGNHGGRDTWVVRINEIGSIVWQKCFGGSANDDCDIKVIQPSGEMVLVGLTFSKNGDITGFKGSEDFWTLRLNASGAKLSSNVLGGRSGDMGSDAVLTSDGMYMAIGRSDSNDGDVTGNHGASDIWTVKFQF